MERSNSTTAGCGAAAKTGMKLKHVKLGYHFLMTHFFALCTVPPFAFALVRMTEMDVCRDFQNLCRYLERNLAGVLVVSGALLFGLTVYYMTRPRSNYLVDYACYLPRPTSELATTVGRIEKK